MLRDIVALPTSIRIYLKTFFFSFRWNGLSFVQTYLVIKDHPKAFFFKQRSWGGDGDFLKLHLVWTDEQTKTENFSPAKNRSLPPYFLGLLASKVFFLILWSKLMLKIAFSAYKLISMGPFASAFENQSDIRLNDYTIPAGRTRVSTFFEN